MSFIQHSQDGVLYHTSSLLTHSAVIHGFSTRHGGVSEGHFASLNFRGSGPEPDTPSCVRENYRRFCTVLGAEMEHLVLSKQVHQDTVRQVTTEDAGKGLFRPTDYTADALVTNIPGMSLMVFSADCIILLFHDSVTNSIGACHAGWRGTALDLPVKTVQEMGRLFGAKPENIRVAIGAGIGPCCFETHNDVPDAMVAAFGNNVRHFIQPRGKKWTIDLKGISAWRLQTAGVQSEHIDICETCTACNADHYWSHRLTGDQRGVQGALIGLRAD